jgi:hypothetical protein
VSWTAIGYTVSAALIVAGFAAFTVAARATWGMRDGEDSGRPEIRRDDAGKRPQRQAEPRSRA